jgi:ABC-type glycerol-3-phosphate transport system permease component
MSRQVERGSAPIALKRPVEEPPAPRRRQAAAPKHAFLLAAVVLEMIPLFFVLITAFKTLDDYSLSKIGPPRSLYLGNFVTALRDGQFFIWLANSAVLAVGAVLLSTTVSALAAFAFARMRFRGSGWLLSVITALMVLPPVVMVVPLFLMLARFDLISTYPGVILVYAGLVTPFSLYFLTNFFRGIPHEIVQAALIDGSSSFGVLTRILLPLSMPALMTLVIVNSLWVWNDLLIALVLLPEDEMRPLMVGITVFGSRYSSDVPVAMAGMLLASLPMLLLYLFGQRYFIRGIVAGALKG